MGWHSMSSVLQAAPWGCGGVHRWQPSGRRCPRYTDVLGERLFHGIQHSSHNSGDRFTDTEEEQDEHGPAI